MMRRRLIWSQRELFTVLRRLNIPLKHMQTYIGFYSWKHNDIRGVFLYGLSNFDLLKGKNLNNIRFSLLTGKNF